MYTNYKCYRFLGNVFNKQLKSFNGWGSQLSISTNILLTLNNTYEIIASTQLAVRWCSSECTHNVVLSFRHRQTLTKQGILSKHTYHTTHSFKTSSKIKTHNNKNVEDEVGPLRSV